MGALSCTYCLTYMDSYSMPPWVPHHRNTSFMKLCFNPTHGQPVLRTYSFVATKHLDLFDNIDRPHFARSPR
mgnify:CR=1 FL=1